MCFYTFLLSKMLKQIKITHQKEVIISLKKPVETFKNELYNLINMPRKKPEIKTVEEKKPEKAKKLTQAEYEKKVKELAKQGITAEKIGQTLKNQKIHPKEYEKSISEILKKDKLYINPDLKNIETKLERVKNQYQKNKQDKRAMREKDRIFSQLRRLKKYFKV